MDPSRLEEALEDIADIIDDLPEEREMEHMLEKAGCCRTLGDIGLKEEIREKSLALAPYVRRRLSLLRIRKMLKIEGESV